MTTIQKQPAEKTPAKVKKPMFRFTVTVNPVTGKERKEIFEVRSEDEDYARLELKRMFKFFAYEHKWELKHTILLVKKSNANIPNPPIIQNHC